MSVVALWERHHCWGLPAQWRSCNHLHALCVHRARTMAIPDGFTVPRAQQLSRWCTAPDHSATTPDHENQLSCPLLPLCAFIHSSRALVHGLDAYNQSTTDLCRPSSQAEFSSVCEQESRDRQCSADSRNLHAGSRRAVPNSRPRIGPKSVPPNGSTNSWWNHMGGQFLGSIGGFPLCRPWTLPVARPSMLSRLGLVSSHADVNMSLHAIALRCFQHVLQAGNKAHEPGGR